MNDGETFSLDIYRKFLKGKITILLDKYFLPKIAKLKDHILKLPVVFVKTLQ